jgi:hypothetical protein
MKELDFRPAKSKEDFRSNYKLHDLAERTGKNLLVQWGVEFQDFGEDKRYEKLWEKGEDKPDLIINHRGQKAFLDWKGKHKDAWIVNERAIKSYERWQKKYNVPVIIAFLVFDTENKLSNRKFAALPLHNYIEVEKKQWDKNKTVEFKEELPVFMKENLVKFLLKKQNLISKQEQ